MFLKTIGKQKEDELFVNLRGESISQHNKSRPDYRKEIKDLMGRVKE